MRLRRLRAFLKETDVEARLCGCVEDLLRVDELPWNPYPSLARLLRKEETRLMLWARPAEAAKQLHGSWREAGLQASSLDPHLSKLNSHCVAWRSLAPLVDAEAVKTLVGQLASTPLLASVSRVEQRDGGDL